MSSLSSQTVRRYILTASVTAITVTGAWYGAGLKTRQEFKEERKVALQVTPAERIEQLEAMRVRLLNQRVELQTKIDRLTAEPSKPNQAAHEESS